MRTLQQRLGESPPIDPPGEVLLPQEICYHAAGGPKAVFFVEHYGRQTKISTVIGIVLTSNGSDGSASSSESPICTAPKVTLSNCLASICLGDSAAHVKQVMSADQEYSGPYDWSYDVNLTPGDLVLDAFGEGTMPDWIYPGHEVRVGFSDGVVSLIYVAVHIDMV